MRPRPVLDVPARASAAWLRLAAITALLLLASPLQGQLRGTVSGARGEPLAGGVVELWSAQGRAAAVRTGAAGEFAFTREQAEPALRVVIHLPGYRTAMRALPGEGALSVRMEPLPVALRS